MEDYKTPEFISRSTANPIIKPSDIKFTSPCGFPCFLVSNPGVLKLKDHYVMVLSTDFVDSATMKWDKSNMLLGYSKDGINFEFTDSHPCEEWFADPEIGRIYDPRLNLVDGKIYITAALDTRHGICLRIAETEDFKKWKICHTTTPDNRNIVLFPEKINGYYARLERPFPQYSRGEHFDIWISYSPDMEHWGQSKLLLGADQVPFCNLKIGPSAPPIKTEAGWLVIYHAADLDADRVPSGWSKNEVWQKRYMAGAMMLDLKDPTRIIGLAPKPLIVPETPYELNGWRGYVVFPTANILEVDGEVRIYYGAADTVVALATAKLKDLIKFVMG